MKEWFWSREPRERVILGAGAVVAALIVAWGFVWKPLMDGTAELRDSVAQKNQLLIDLRQAAVIAPAAGGGAPGAAQSLLVLVDSTAQSHGLAGALTRTRQDGPDGVNVTFQNASFDALMSWLVTLHSEHRVGVESATVTRTQQPGLVNGQIFLRRS